MAAPLDRLQARLRRDLFLPLGFRLSLVLEQVTWAEAAADPALATFAIRSGQRLLGADGAVNWFDTWLEAEGAGVQVGRGALGEAAGAADPLASVPEAAAVLASEPVERVLEVTRRLATEAAEQSALLGFLTGGATLAAHLLGAAAGERLVRAFAKGRPSKRDADLLDSLAQISIKIADAYCAAGVSALLLAEEGAVTTSAYLAPFEPLFNLASYYNVPVIFAAREGLAPALAGEIRKAGVAHVLSAPGERAVAVPLDALSDEACGRAWFAGAPGSRGSRILMSEWDLLPSTKAEKVKALSHTVQQ